MNPQNVKRVAVIGAGVMGHSIAQVFAQAGILVNLVDLKKDLLAHALKLVESNLQTLADCGRVNPQAIPAILDRIRPTTDLADGVKRVDFVLEAVVEIPEVKKRVFAQLEAACPEDMVLASNTSGLEIFKIIEVKNPSRVVVTHWFAPPHIIPLVEVVPGPSTAPGVLQFAAELMERIGKKPLVMKQFIQRFIVNRIQNAIVRTALEMVTNGWATPEQIDLAVKTSLGIRLPIVGVVQSLDFTGLNLIHDMTKGTEAENPLIEEKVRQGHLGASTSKGIYDYGGRSEEEILRKRDLLYLKMLDFLEGLQAFKPV
ncbi:MAG TPA: 3-hydroxyacyl-CoA dehydrogenase family protein [Thermodesulfobacteriota bacterium]|nr:3-hydroxyacyl-CoA dehydrogenase family protein [Thermodesulfobacteriota bacterium]